MDVRLAGFLLAAAALGAAHQVGDHWLQTSHQAAAKGGTGWRARLACARHVATYTAAQALTLTVAAKRLSVPLDGRAAAALVAAGRR